MGLASSKWKWAFAFSSVMAAVTVNACVGDDPAASSPGGTSADGGGGSSNTCKTGTNSCASGTCVDGFCCDRACDGQCEACDVAGHEGTCTTVTGAPHHAACAGDQTGTCAGSCDGKLAASCTYPTVACGPGGSCAGGVAQVPATCGNGTCAPATTQTCSLGCFEDGCLGVVQIAAGYTNACALLTDTKVRCWGDNSNGALGLGSVGTTNYSTPQQVTLLDSAHVKMLGGSNGGFCAVLGDGSVECWGANGSGQLGLGTVPDVDPHPTPAAAANVSGATFISSSTTSRFCAIIAGGQVKCWGDNSSGALGIGSAAANNSTPTLLCAPGSTSVPCTPATGVTFIATGDSHTCGVFAGGTVACWGANDDGELGFTPDANPHPFPITISGLTATYLTAGNQTSCAATTSGAAMCWGSNNGGQVGAATVTDPISTPTSVCTKQDCSTHLTGVTGVGTYDDSVCALASGAVLCWGNNNEGQLGDGNAEATQNYAASTAIATGATYVRAGGQTNFAVVKTGGEVNVKCWGDNNNHECGNGDDAGTQQKTPVSPTW